MAMVIAASSSARADVVANWDFSGLDYTTTNADGLVQNAFAPNPVLAAASGNAITGTTISDLTPSIAANELVNSSLRATVNNGSALGEANLNNWDIGGDGVNENYLEFTITAATAGTLNIDDISISQWRNGGGAPDGMAFDVSVDGGDFVLYDSVKTDAASGSGPSFDTFTFSSPISNADSVAFRFAPRTVSEGSTGNLHINGITVNGSVATSVTILGDCNFDGTVDFLDISPFIAVLSGGGILAEADCNQDSAVDFLDISPFIAILSGG